MKRLALLALLVSLAKLCFASNVTNTVMMVDQRGNLNVEGVASVAQVATNAVKVQIAEAKADAAQATALGVTNAIPSPSAASILAISSESLQSADSTKA